MKHIAASMAILVGLACTAHAAPPDATARQRKADMLDLYIKTKLCMRDAGIAGLRYSNDHKEVQRFMIGACAAPFTLFLREDMPEAQALTIVSRMTRNTFYVDVLGIPEPAPIK